MASLCRRAARRAPASTRRHQASHSREPLWGPHAHADSWGSDVISYDSSAASLDQWVYDKPEFVAAIAAGNYGEQDGIYK